MAAGGYLQVLTYFTNAQAMDPGAGFCWAQLEFISS
jgi:hypothetical protein